MEFLRDICHRDPEALDRLDSVLQRPGGGNNNPHGCKGKPEEEITVDNIHGDSTPHPTGTSREAALRRLRKDRPDLHGRVIAGEMTCHGAMKEAGFRKVPTPMELARKIIGKLTPAERQMLIAEMMEREADAA